MVGFSHKVSSTLILSTLGTVYKNQKGLLPFGPSAIAQVAGAVPVTASVFFVACFLVWYFKCSSGIVGVVCTEFDLSEFFFFLVWSCCWQWDQVPQMDFSFLLLLLPGKEIEERGKVVAWEMVAESEDLNHLRLPVNSENYVLLRQCVL